MLKGIWSAFQEGKTFELIASKGVKIRVSHRERLEYAVGYVEDFPTEINWKVCLVCAGSETVAPADRLLRLPVPAVVPAKHTS